MTVFRIYSVAIALVALNYLARPPASLAQPQSLPAESSTAEGGGVSATSTGVAYPVKGGSIRREKIKDELPPAQRSQQEKERVAQLGFSVDPRVQIQKYLKSLKFPKERQILCRGNISYIESEALKNLFPNSVFYVLRFPQWPLPLDPPQPLGSNNIFVIAKEAKDLTLITDTKKELYKLFLIKSLPHIQSDEKAIQSVKGSLVLIKELFQDGMFQFENDAKSIYANKAAGAIRAGGKLNVIPQGGNSGTLSVTLLFDKQGVLSDIKYESNLQEGMRPICQSTKLLDPDPIVRKMAEQDILIMGSSAKDYLDWQRTLVSPELRQAIDRIWNRIILEGR